jgi:hypothetical protein
MNSSPPASVVATGSEVDGAADGADDPDGDVGGGSCRSCCCCPEAAAEIDGPAGSLDRCDHLVTNGIFMALSASTRVWVSKFSSLLSLLIVSTCDVIGMRDGRKWRRRGNGGVLKESGVD